LGGAHRKEAVLGAAMQDLAWDEIAGHAAGTAAAAQHTAPVTGQYSRHGVHSSRFRSVVGRLADLQFADRSGRVA